MRIAETLWRDAKKERSRGISEKCEILKKSFPLTYLYSARTLIMFNDRQYNSASLNNIILIRFHEHFLQFWNVSWIFRENTMAYKWFLVMISVYCGYNKWPSLNSLTWICHETFYHLLQNTGGPRIARSLGHRTIVLLGELC